MSNNILSGTKAVVISPMEEDIKRGESIRLKIKKELNKLNITLWDHYDRPFIEKIEESEQTHSLLKHYRESGQYDKISEYRSIRLQDLAMVDAANFIICIFEKKTFSAGTMEEFFWANRIKKPIFFIWGDGKENCPFWIFWTIPHKYIYSSIDEALDMIRKIDSGEKEIDNSRWRLMKEEYR